MNDVTNGDFVRSQLTVIRWHLDRVAEVDPAAAQEHIANARRAFETVMQLLPTMQLSGTARVQALSELAALRDQLRTQGEDV